VIIMCMGGEAMADDDMERVQECVLGAYRTWRKGFDDMMPEDVMAGVSEEYIVDAFLSDIRVLILDKG